MNDQITTIEQLKKEVALMVQERAWEQFHSPKNLSMNIAVEAAELMEKFLWCDNKDSYQEIDSNKVEVEHEFADVLIALLAFANSAGIDVSSTFERKLALVKEKYPVEKAHGKSTKYNKL